jgi:uncharacterized Ntn-hydrolase superfamily protein
MGPSTFSMVACDLDRREWGVAVASRFLAVGAGVPYARAEIGAVATQALANTTYGPQGLEQMAKGASAQEALTWLLERDEQREHRQVGILDAAGQAATFTGRECMQWAGGRVGASYACQGNILAGPRVIEQMALAFETSEGELADRLLAALLAGEEAGGDRRGKQSAALLVVKAGAGYGGFSDRYLDLRVDDDREPVSRLAHLLNLHHLYFGKSEPSERLALEGKVLVAVQRMLRQLGFYRGAGEGRYDQETQSALRQLTGRENLEDRVFLEEGAIDPPALEYLRALARASGRPRRASRRRPRRQSRS